MRDGDVRRVLKERLNATYRAEENTIVVEELGLCGGIVRVDIAVINGRLKGYEIKSDSDTLNRLPSQAQAYNRIFDTVSIVVAERHCERAEGIVPAWWGIEEATGDVSAVHLRKVREEALNTEVDPLALVQLLWRDEVLGLLSRICPSDRVANRPRSFLWQALVSAVPICTLKELVNERLKSRKCWRVQKEQKQDDEMSQLYAKSSGSLYPRVDSRSRRYIHRPS